MTFHVDGTPTDDIFLTEEEFFSEYVDRSKLYVAGYGFNGDLGLGDTIHRSVYTEFTSGKFKTIAALEGGNGSGPVLGIRSDNTLWIWGRVDSNFPIVTDNGIISGFYSSPVQISSDTVWKDIAVDNTITNGYNIVAIKNDGTLWSVGNGVYGVSGTGSNVNTSTFTQIGSSSDWDKVYSSFNLGRFALKNDGSMYSWGYNGTGTLGHNSITEINVPTKVTLHDPNGELVYKDIALFGSSCAVLTEDGKVYTCGSNAYGQLGLGDLVDRSVFTQITQSISGVNYYKKISGSNSLLALIGDNDLLYGVGNKDATNRYTNVSSGANSTISPFHGTNVGYRDVLVSRESVHAVGLDGKLYAWGSSSYGQLGTNNRTAAYMPGGTNNVRNVIKMFGRDYSSYVVVE